MTNSLKKAFEAASKLSPGAHDALAAAILEEVAAEGLWEDAFARRPDALAKLADEALADYRAGKTTPPGSLEMAPWPCHPHP